MTSEAESLKNRGNAHRAAGSLDEALACYRRALQADPDYGPALYNLGVVLQERGSFAEAEPCFARLRALDPGDRDSLFRLGLVLAELARYPEAAQAFSDALALDPENPLLWLRLAQAQRASGDAARAKRSASRALEIEPKLAEAHNLLGMLLQDEGSLAAAIGHYREALALVPDNPAYCNNLGCALNLGGAAEESVRHLQRAVELQPQYFDAHVNLGNVYSVLGRRELAARSFKAAHALSPQDASLTADLLFELQQLCEWPQLGVLSEARRRNVAAHPDKRIDPFGLFAIASTRQEQLQAARSFARHHARAAAAAGQGFSFARQAKRRLKVGYLSADFHEHATAYLAAGLFELHDRERFEVYAYSYGPDDASPMRARLRRGFDRFLDIAAVPPAEAARAIHQDGIDILVDLKGYTTHARPGIVALRPAPIQVNYLGYPGTMGADFIDYLVADAFVVPPEHEPDYSEKLVLMPGSYQVNDRQRPLPPTPGRGALGLAPDAFVFCCFNQAYKIMPGVFDAWMRMLAAVPGSVLWLLDSAALANLRREAAARGVDPARLVAAPPLPLAQHLARIGAADLFLDTLPYNAHTSASDALWMGLPVLTCPGDTFASRVAGSLLAAVGMPELIAGSLEQYEATALRLGSNPAELAGLRGKLRAARNSAPLFDTPGFARAIEAAYVQMWQHLLAGGGPHRIVLS